MILTRISWLGVLLTAWVPLWAIGAITQNLRVGLRVPSAGHDLNVHVKIAPLT
jgi:hypothetical protein